GGRRPTPGDMETKGHPRPVPGVVTRAHSGLVKESLFSQHAQVCAPAGKALRGILGGRPFRRILPMSITPQEALQRTIEHREIFHEEMVGLMRQIMGGQVSPVMTAAILSGLRVKKETVGEIAGAAVAMREFSRTVEVADRTHLVDIVGTGGDGAHTFNISTAAAFVAAAAGARVAKHGNRSVSSKSGSADAFEALGAAIELQPPQVAQAIDQTGIGFMYAPIHHPAMKQVAQVRG